jgi:hypothetical protein
VTGALFLDKPSRQLMPGGFCISRGFQWRDAMTDNTAQDIATRRVLYTLPGMDTVRIRRDVEYRRAGEDVLTMDLYYPAQPEPGALSAVVFVTGFPDPGARRILGRPAKDMGSYTSWAQLVAASGLTAITYVNNTPADAVAVLDYVRENAVALNVEPRRIGVWSCSGSGPMGLSVLMQGSPHPPKCGALVYPYTLDLGDAAGVAAAAKQWGFTNACSGHSVADFPCDRPLFVARAGQDQMPGLNDGLDRFVCAALMRNLPISVVNHVSGPHAFDLFDDSDMTRNVVQQILAFFCFQLRQGSLAAAA